MHNLFVWRIEGARGREKKSCQQAGSGGIRTHAPGETGALIQRLRPLGHATMPGSEFFLVLFFNLDNVPRLLREILCSGASTGQSRTNHTPTSRIRLSRVSGAESAPCAPLTKDESWSPDHRTQWFGEEHSSHSDISLLGSGRGRRGRLLHYHLFYFYILTVIFCWFYKLKQKQK